MTLFLLGWFLGILTTALAAALLDVFADASSRRVTNTLLRWFGIKEK